MRVKEVPEKSEAFNNLEQDVFKALENQKRRDILRLIGEKRGISFTDILSNTKLADSPTLSYHLRELSPFISQKQGKYELSPIGKDAYNLLQKTTSYGKVVLFQKKRMGATFGNLLLWSIGVFAAAYLGVELVLWAVIMPFLALIATGTTWQLFEEVKV
jgi:DNA-binding transcriptional ArsR family regulator